MRAQAAAADAVVTLEVGPLGKAPASHASLRILLALCVAAAVLPSSRAGAQLIPVKTVPVAAGDQFLLFPASHLAMGEVGIALPDTLGDPFRSPAAGGRLGESFFFGSPTFYSISDRNGSGRTLPLGGFFSSGDWFGGAAFALQELKSAGQSRGWPVAAPSWSSFAWPWPAPRLSEASARNLFAFALLGHRMPELGLSLAASAYYADLRAVDGVELLYAMSDGIRQSGHVSDLRLGLLKEWADGREFELILLSRRFRMRHEVSYLDLVWDVVPGYEEPVPVWQPRLEVNQDHSDTWGAHLAFRKPLSAPGWTLGWSLSANRKDHPKIPDYEIQNIPRDPGNTHAYALGVGIGRVEGPTRFAADLILEPIHSETWAEAASDTTTVTGGTIRAGERTVDNDFAFTNALLRVGAAMDYRKATLSLGVQVRSVSYELDQFDHVQIRRRTQEESWMEWTPSVGVSLRLSGATFDYAGRLTTGTGRPGVTWTGPRMDALEAGADFLTAPSGPLTLQDARVATHRFTVVIPVR